MLVAPSTTLAPEPAPEPMVLALTLEDREALLAALEIVCAIADGQMVEALFMARSAYRRDALRARLNALADQVFTLYPPLAGPTPAARRKEVPAAAA